jgi:hypothetical protein
MPHFALLFFYTFSENGCAFFAAMPNSFARVATAGNGM